MINILVLTCGTNASYHFIKTIKEKFSKDFNIIGTDINEQYLTPTCNYLDKFYKVPYSNDESYYPTILDICEKENIDIILPSLDIDQQLFYTNNPDLEKLGIKSLGTPQESLKIYSTKEEMNKFLIKNGFNVPKEYETVEENLKYFVKPKNGFGSIGAKVLTGKEINELQDKDNLLIQEICLEPEITLECFYFDNKLSTVARERIASKSGVCTKTKVYYDKELEKIALKLTRCLKLPYYFNLQFMKNQNNEYAITDVNLRLAGGMSLSYATGWDEVSAVANILLGRNDEVFKTLISPKTQTYVVRAYTDIVTKEIKQTVAFDLDGTLLDSRQRHVVVLDDILKKHNISIDTSNLIEFKRTGKNNVDFLISKGVEKELAKKIQIDWIQHIEDDEYLKLDKLYPNTFDLLNEYKNHDLILITARNRKDAVLKQLKELDLEKYFKNIFVVQSNKNSIQAKAEILKQENSVLVFGDTEVDYKAAQLAGIDFRFCDNGFREKIC